MEIIRRLGPYEDDRDNRIEYGGTFDGQVWIGLRGANNRLFVDDGANLKYLKVVFDCDNAVVRLGPSAGVPRLSITVRAGQDSTVTVGANVSSTERVYLSATEGTSVTVGDDVMFSSLNEVRADDAHPIFDIHTDKRVNVSRSVVIGNHVWLAREAIVLGGVTVGDGAVLGYRSLVTRSIPNNCIAVGVPAKVTKRDIAWERPHLDHQPPYKPDASTVTKSPYWNPTLEPIVRQRSRRPLSRLFGR